MTDDEHNLLRLVYAETHGEAVGGADGASGAGARAGPERLHQRAAGRLGRVAGGLTASGRALARQMGERAARS